MSSLGLLVLGSPLGPLTFSPLCSLFSSSPPSPPPATLSLLSWPGSVYWPCPTYCFLSPPLVALSLMPTLKTSSSTIPRDDPVFIFIQCSPLFILCMYVYGTRAGVSTCAGVSTRVGPLLWYACVYGGQDVVLGVFLDLCPFCLLW